jgi:hypothetical protein
MSASEAVTRSGEREPAPSSEREDYIKFADAMLARLFWPNGSTRDDAKPYGIARLLAHALKVLASKPQEPALDLHTLEGERLASRLCNWESGAEPPVPLMQEAARYIRSVHAGGRNG